MIPKSVLKALIKKRLDDAKVLFNNRRYQTTIYIAGYALELALKYRICLLMKFSNGFPENRIEFDSYYSDTRKVLLRNTIRELRDIRHHDLQRLLRFSGEQVNVDTNFLTEWNYIKQWNPEMRYANNIIRKQRATDFLKNIRLIISGIL